MPFTPFVIARSLESDPNVAESASARVARVTTTGRFIAADQALDPTPGIQRKTFVLGARCLAKRHSSRKF